MTESTEQDRAREEDLVHRLRSLRAAVRITIHEEMERHYDLSLAECYLLLDGSQVQDETIASLRKEVERLREVLATEVRLHDETDEWNEARIAKMQRVVEDYRWLLGCVTYPGHPGKPCLRTDWIDKTKVESLWKALSDLSEDSLEEEDVVSEADALAASGRAIISLRTRIRNLERVVALGRDYVANRCGTDGIEALSDLDSDGDEEEDKGIV